MKISEHFSLEELTQSQVATRLGIKNVPSQIELANLYLLAAALEIVRNLLNNLVMRISSGFRCLGLNRAIGSDDSSAHTKGFAVDFTCPNFGTPRQVCEAIIASGIKFDQLILEGVSSDNPDGVWVHLSVETRMRNQVLTAKFTNGKARYSQGLICQ